MKGWNAPSLSLWVMPDRGAVNVLEGRAAIWQVLSKLKELAEGNHMNFNKDKGKVQAHAALQAVDRLGRSSLAQKNLRVLLKSKLNVDQPRASDPVSGCVNPV